MKQGGKGGQGRTDQSVVECGHYAFGVAVALLLFLIVGGGLEALALLAR